MRIVFHRLLWSNIYLSNTLGNKMSIENQTIKNCFLFFDEEEY